MPRAPAFLLRCLALLLLGLCLNAQAADPAEAPPQDARKEIPSASPPQAAPSADAPKEVPLGGAPKEVPLGDAPKELPLGGAPKEPSSRVAPKEAPSGETPQTPVLRDAPKEASSADAPKATAPGDVPKDISSGNAPQAAPLRDAAKEAPPEDASKAPVPQILPQAPPSADIPRDTAGFTRYAAGRLAAVLPDQKFTPAGELTLEATRADGASAGQLHLDRVYEFCLRNASICEDAVGRYARGIVQMNREAATPIAAAMVRLEVRPRQYIAQVRARLGPEPAPLYERALTPNLSVVPVLDFPRSTRFVNARDLTALKVTEAQLFKLGEDNLRAAQKPLPELLRVPPPQALGRIFDEDYAASRIIFHDDWNDLAKALRGTLVLMLPASNYLIYGGEANAEALDAMKNFGLEIASRSTRPLSPLLLRWTPTGWEEIATLPQAPAKSPP